jgi:hypothetical protein
MIFHVPQVKLMSPQLVDDPMIIVKHLMGKNFAQIFSV